MLHRILRWLGYYCLLCAMPVLAQGNMCSELVERALETVGDNCTSIGRNEVCYGYAAVEATNFEHELIADFAASGDTVSVGEVATLATVAFNADNDVWGIAMLSLQADLPDTLPGQNVTVIVYGDTEITSEVAEDADDTAPMQAFHLTTGIGESNCDALPPDGLLVQAPTEMVVHLTVNGIEVEVGSTALLSLTEDELTVNTFAGLVTVTSGDESQEVEPGFQTVAVADAPPSEPEPYAYQDVKNAPVNLLPEAVVIPLIVPAVEGSAGWVNSGVVLEAGQQFRIAAYGEVSIWPGCSNVCTSESIVTEFGTIINCSVLCESVTAGPAGEEAISSVVPDSAPYFVMPDATLTALLGRIGESEPFLVGDGGTFTAENDGTLQFHINEDSRVLGDETGYFVVAIEIVPE